MIEQFSNIEHQAAQDSGPQEKGNKWDEVSAYRDRPCCCEDRETQAELECLSELKRWSW